MTHGHKCRGITRAASQALVDGLIAQGRAHLAFDQRHVRGFVIVVVERNAFCVGVHHTDLDHFYLSPRLLVLSW